MSIFRQIYTFYRSLCLLKWCLKLISVCFCQFVIEICQERLIRDVEARGQIPPGMHWWKWSIMKYQSLRKLHFQRYDFFPRKCAWRFFFPFSAFLNICNTYNMAEIAPSEGQTSRVQWESEQIYQNLHTECFC